MSPSSSASESAAPQGGSRRALTETLTPRQIECLSWVQEGKTAWEIGQIMGISHRTVEYYLALVFEKLDVRTRVQAVVRARSLGLL
ncbi:helix-turn-helix domain-containing protein [Phenylobacterium sp.]|uniref:helix-turn-helix domain-containing protein n=1 Tax=Phenylobacterium sp. TaxID=1871053 RepID=UPI003BABB2B7